MSEIRSCYTQGNLHIFNTVSQINKSSNVSALQVSGGKPAACGCAELKIPLLKATKVNLYVTHCDSNALIFCLIGALLAANLKLHL